ncbi:MAG TPA: tripartite tricarboxylate transporter substrate binding protein [Casimicrobiaceae bacterium]|nr:tripartite tricarboxylate transporter substrate binding protein [Casimicrobiaceae bacterium]
MKFGSSLFASVLIAVLGSVQAFAADSFPSKPIKVVDAWPAGGVVDVITRAVTQKLSEDWATPLVVENKPGAYGLIGTEFVAKSAPDGYTWLIGTLGTPMSSSLYNKPWKAVERFAGVAILARSALLAVVPADLPANSLREFVALAKSEPGQLNYLNPSIGSASHLNVELIKAKEHIDVVSVPYNGQPPGVADLLTGRLQFALLAPQVAAPQIRAGKLKALAVAFPTRIAAFPDLPTFAEAGYPYADVVATYSILVPKQTPSDVVAKISAGVEKALKDPTVQKRIDAAAAEVASSVGPKQVDTFLKAETVRWEQFFREHSMNPK